MGIESFNITVLPHQVSIVSEGGYWRLEGTSTLDLKKVDEKLKILGAVKCKCNDWVIDDCIEIREYTCKGYFQGLELRGCLSNIKSGTELCCRLIETMDKEIIPLNVFVLNKKINFKNSEELYEVLQDMYGNKITIFNKQYGNIQLKVTCREFYKEIKKRKKWYYKIFYNLKLFFINRKNKL